MKNIIILIFSFLLLAPPMQAHTDVVVYNEVADIHSEIENLHENEQHKNDSEDEKQREHHHHCHTVNLENCFISTDFEINFNNISVINSPIIYIENLNNSTSLDGVFQPPKYS